MPAYQKSRTLGGNPFAGPQTSRDPTPRSKRPQMSDLLKLSGDGLPQNEHVIVGRGRVSSFPEAGAAQGLSSAETVPRRRSHAVIDYPPNSQAEETKLPSKTSKDLILAKGAD